MADTVIDSLTVLLKLDPRQYNDEQKKLIQSLGDTKNAAASTAKDLEGRGRQGAQFFDQITSSALKLSALLVGGVGIKDFVQSTVTGGAAAGRFANNIGITVQQLSLWQNAIRQIGGDVNQVGPALLGLSQSLTTIALRGPGSSDLLATFQALGVTLTDPLTGRIKTVTELLPELHDAFQKVSPGVAYNLGSALGLTPDFINLLEQSDPAYQKYISNAKQVGTITEQQAKDFAALQQAWSNFTGTLETAGREVLDEVAGPLTALLNALTAISEALDAVGDSTGASDLGAFIGGVAGFLVGGPVGAAAGVVAGGLIGAGASGPSAAHASAGSGLFGLIGGLEGGKEGSVTPTGLPNDPYAYGKNQITLGTAQRYDPQATAAKLLTGSYNDALARKIEGDYNARYHGDVDAIALAYHNGPGAADRFLASGRSLSGFGPQTQQYIARERSAVGGAGKTTVQIDQISINSSASTLTGVGSDVGNGIRSALASNALVSQGNVGPQ